MTPTAAPARTPAAPPPPPDVVHDLDALLASSDVTALDPRDANALRLRHVRDAVAWHIDRNDRYARYCAGLGFTAQDLRTPADLSRVPLLPSSLFKRGGDVVATAPADAHVLETTSSGTRGTVSVVPRDDRTLNRFFAGVGIGTYEVLGQERSELQVFNIGPLDAGHLWIAYVMAGVALFSDGECYVEDDTFRLRRFLDDLRRADGGRVMVVGPPTLVLAAAEAARDEQVRVHPESMVVTIGGWKKATGSMVPRAEFVTTVVDALGLVGDSAVRDTFNMVELNTVLFECAEHRLHVPPWLFLESKHPRTLAPLASGECGVLAFVDPTPTSYPAFVLTDDFGSVDREVPCGCGRTSDVLRIDRRINRVEGRGCALKLDAGTAR